MNDDSAIHRFCTRRRVEFADTDMGGIVHFSRFFIFMETAEHELLRALGASAHGVVGGRTVAWPRVAASCEYLRPARFGDELEIEVTVQRKGRSSMTYGFEFLRDGVPLARGRMTSVCCLMDDPETLEATAIPSSLAERLVEAPSGEHE
jgi:4-hydroxybenzoyl-CoA thioesterase/acyl-CoA thioester hydrolase